jgi:hypothetical protein
MTYSAAKIEFKRLDNATKGSGQSENAYVGDLR